MSDFHDIVSNVDISDEDLERQFRVLDAKTKGRKVRTSGMFGPRLVRCYTCTKWIREGEKYISTIEGPKHERCVGGI